MQRLGLPGSRIGFADFRFHVHGYLDFNYRSRPKLPGMESRELPCFAQGLSEGYLVYFIYVGVPYYGCPAGSVRCRSRVISRLRGERGAVAQQRAPGALRSSSRGGMVGVCRVTLTG